MPQPPDAERVHHILNRCRDLHGEPIAHLLEAFLEEAWEYAADHEDTPADRAVWCAAQLLLQASNLRRDGHHSVANMAGHLAEACIDGWRQELTVQAATIPDTPAG